MTSYTPSYAWIFTEGTYAPSHTFDFDAISDPVGNLTETLEDTVGVFQAYITVEGDIAETLEDTVGSLHGNQFFNLLMISDTLEDTVGGLVCFYDPNVIHWISSETVTVSETTTNLPPISTDFPVQQATQETLDSISIQEQAKALNTCMSVSGEQATIINPDEIASIQEQAAPLNTTEVGINTEQATVTNPDKITSVIEAGTWLTDVTLFPKQQGTVTNPDKITSVNQDSNHQRDFLLAITMDEPLDPYRYTASADFDFTENSYTPDKDDFTWDYGRPDALAINHRWGVVSSEVVGDFQIATFYDDLWHIVYEETKQPDRGISPWIDLPPPPVNPEPPTGTSHTVPIQEVYTMQNIILVTLDDGTTEIHLDKIGINLDADSYAWNFSANLLDSSQKSLIIQNADGTAKIIHVTINGYVWYLLVEKIVTTKRFGQTSIKISGRSLTALMGKPYNQIGSVNFGSLLTNQQIVDQILPLGWTVIWDMPVWNISAGAYGYQNKTTVDALKEIADMMGSSIVPTRDSQEITFRSRYPVSPWNFDATTADIVITDDAILELTEEPSARYNGNGIYIHGTETGGQLGFVRLSSTVDPSDGSGSRLTPTVSNALMTDANIGIRHLGERILSGQYEQPAIKGFKTFMDGVIVPLIEIGYLVGTTIDGVETKGVCNSISIQASHVEVSQQITIGDSTPNNWVAFNELLPKDPLLIATLSSTTGTTSLMILIDGGVVRVRGTGTVNSKYYIRSGEIVSDAPDLPASNIVLG